MHIFLFVAIDDVYKERIQQKNEFGLLEDLCGVVISEANMIPDIWVHDIASAHPWIFHGPISQVEIKTMDVFPESMEM